MSRTATIQRKTAETDIRLEVDLDGGGRAEIATGIGFFDHMLTLLAKHAALDLTIEAKGVSMWSKKPTPVAISARPPPSRSTSSRISVSAVLR